MHQCRAGLFPYRTQDGRDNGHKLAILTFWIIALHSAALQRPYGLPHAVMLVA